MGQFVVLLVICNFPLVIHLSGLNLNHPVTLILVAFIIGVIFIISRPLVQDTSRHSSNICLICLGKLGKTYGHCAECTNTFHLNCLHDWITNSQQHYCFHCQSTKGVKVKGLVAW